MDERNPAPSPHPSLLSANLLYLTGAVMLLTVGAFLQWAHFGWGLLATELLIGALALLWTRLNRMPWRPTLRLYPAAGRSVLLAAFVGLGLWLIDTWLGAVSSLLFGYDVPVPPGTYPQSIPAALLLFVALAIGAPLGEELFFRGYVQRAYERLQPVYAVVLVALLFALFHMTLVGLPPRLPVALALGYIAWRSGSLWPAVALHAANNAAAALFLILIGLRPDLLDAVSGTALAPGAPLSALIGLILLFLPLWLFGRSVAPRPEPVAAASGEPRRGLLTWVPLVVSLLIFGAVAALELVSGRFPELLATQPLTLQPLPWEDEVEWHYRLQHPGEETVGSAACELLPGDDAVRLNCALHHDAFEVRIGRSVWTGGDFTRSFTLLYDTQDATLREIDETRAFDDSGYSVQAVPQGDRLLLEVQGSAVSESAEAIPSTALVDELWPWQLAALPFAAGGAFRATLVYPQRYDPELERSVLAVTRGAVIVGGAEPLSVPAGDYLAWRVSVAGQTAWYDVDPPHTLLRYDSGPLIWQYLGPEAAE